MPYTKKQIEEFHKNKRAIEGKLYVGPKNALYIGTDEGYLFRQLTMKGEVTGTHLSSIISSFDKYSRAELLELLELIRELEEEMKTKASKCFATAMALVL